MRKRERLERTLSGDAVDRIPVFLWRHWPGDDQRAADFAWATLLFQRTYDWDFVKVTPFSAYCVTDYGAQTGDWGENFAGDRVITRYPVRRSLAWTELRPLDPLRGEMGKHIEALRLIGDGLRAADVPIVTTVYSPLTQAAMLSGDEMFLRNMRTREDRVRSALNIITESTLRFIDALKRTDVMGIVYVMRHASFGVMAEVEYQLLGAPYDRKILEALPDKWWLNIAQLESRAPMFELAASYPLPVILWDLTETRPTLREAQSLYQGVLCGGLSAESHVHRGTPAMARDAVRQIVDQTGTRRFILSAGRAIPVSAPLSNLRAVREIADELKMV